MTTATLPSGRTLSLTMAPFSVGSKLFKTITGELRAVNVDFDKLAIDPKKDLNLAALDAKTVNTVKNVVCQLCASDAVETAVFDCLARCVIDNKKVGRDAFEAEDARGDYLPAAWEVIRHNLSPFFAGLNLSSLIGGAETESAPSSAANSTPTS